jgi:hypothetical protein
MINVFSPLRRSGVSCLMAGALLLGWGCASSDVGGPAGSGGAPVLDAGGGSGGAPGSGGSGGNGSGGDNAGATGGAGGSGGAMMGDALGGDTVNPGDGPPFDPDGGLAPLEECKTPSIDRIQYFGASGEGRTVPMSGTLLVKEGDHYVAKQQYLGAEWHVTEVLIGNNFNTQVDLTASKGFTMTYSSMADLWIQMRPGFHYSGGAQWVTKVPATNGQVQRTFFPFDPASWTTISLGKPTWTYAMARAAVRGLLIVGDKPNVFAISGFRIDSYIPVCK